ncbi:MAG TPA: hypothetical protein VNJ07_05595 [Chitinophagales bacterium]|nr:hypothetical protein [Chitinophagales bacterium]
MSGKSPADNKLSPFLIKLTHWEFWPFYIVYIPVYFYFLWLAVKARSLFFFSASNPGVETGGLFGESKWNVLQKVSPELIPKTVLIKSETPIAVTLERLRHAGIGFPLIAKPDIGERGFLVEKIEDARSLEGYLSRFKIDFLLQEYVDDAFEYNILFYKMPGEANGCISSVTIKQYMSVTGDGKSSVLELMQRDYHAVMQVERFKKEKRKVLEMIPARGETLKIEPIGNHARGATFFDGRKLIDKRMTDTFNAISKRIPDMNIFRFDVKCKAPDDLKTGLFKIVELNGAGGEPTHIYETGYSLFRAWKDLLHQWNIIYTVSRLNHKSGVKYMSFKEGIGGLKNYLAYKSRLRTIGVPDLKPLTEKPSQQE